jgi:hypothetical protein
VTFAPNPPPPPPPGTTTPPSPPSPPAPRAPHRRPPAQPAPSLRGPTHSGRSGGIDELGPGPGPGGPSPAPAGPVLADNVLRPPLHAGGRTPAHLAVGAGARGAAAAAAGRRPPAAGWRPAQASSSARGGTGGPEAAQLAPWRRWSAGRPAPCIVAARRRRGKFSPGLSGRPRGRSPGVT